jgi:tetratricopeptide (TPR) repeat protein
MPARFPPSVRPGPSASDLERLLNQGRELHSKGRLRDAFALYQRVLAADPTHADAMQLTGLSYLGMGMPAIGIAFLRKAIARQPGLADYHLNLANALARQGQTAEAAAELAQACALRPTDAEARAELAALQLALGEPVQAEASYAQAIALGPERAEWHEALARLQHERWACAEALASAERAGRLSDSVGRRLTLGFARPAAAAPRPPLAGLLRSAAALDDAALARAADALNLLVVDDFLPDPLAVREHALRLCEQMAIRPGGAVYPGAQTPPQPIADTMQRVADWLGQAVKWDSADHGALRCSLASDEARADVHVDSPTLPHIYGGVLYLTLPGDCAGGTSFYRHRATGWAGRPDAATLKAAGHASFLDFQKRHLPPNRQRPFAEWQDERDRLWEWMFEVPMRFNRLIIFRSDFFHSITNLFGTDLASGRLVQLFHFQGEY